MRVRDRELWHYQYPPNTGSTIGNRGVGIYGNWLFSKRPTATWSAWTRTGKERWKVSIADPKLDYTSTVAPVVIGNHVHRRYRGGPSWTIPASSSRAIPRRIFAMEVVDHAAERRTGHGHMA